MIVQMREHESNPDFSGSALNNGYRIEFHRWGTDPVLLRSLQERAALLNDRIFRINPLQTADEIYHHMRRDPTYKGSITFATLNGRDVGFCIQEFIEVPVLGGEKERVVWTALRGIERRHQGKGIGTEFLRRGFREYSDYDPKYYSGRTQDEIVFQSLRSSRLFGMIYPIDRLYSGVPQQILRFVAGRVMYPHPVNPRIGLVKRAYPEGETGGYTLDLERPGIRSIRDRLINLGLTQEERKAGGAFIYVAVVNKNREAA